MKKSLIVVLFIFLLGSCNEEFVEFPIILKKTTGELSYPNNITLDTESKQRVIVVLTLNQIPIRVNNKRILIPIQYANDKDLMYNLYTKSIDKSWIEDQIEE